MGFSPNTVVYGFTNTKKSFKYRSLYLILSLAPLLTNFTCRAVLGLVLMRCYRIVHVKHLALRLAPRKYSYICAICGQVILAKLPFF